MIENPNGTAAGTPTPGDQRCECGHTYDWHAADGGPCEVGPPCECQGYVADARAQ